MKSIGVAFLLLMYCLGAKAQEYVLSGSIGTHPVVLSLTYRQNECFGTYFYTSSLKDITIDGTRRGRTCHLFALSLDHHGDKTDTSEHFVLTRKNDTTWTGVWQDNNRKKLQVHLTLSKQPYASIRRSLFTYAIDSTVKRGKYVIEFYHTVQSPAFGVRITAGPDKAIVKKINNLLYSQLIDNAEGYCTCTNSYRTSEFSSALTYFFINDHVMSVVTETAFDCGGPHPDESTNDCNINLDDGRQLALADLLLFHDRPDADSAAILTVDNAGSITELLTALYPGQMVAQKTDQQCDYTDDMVWEYCAWYFKNEGVGFDPSFQHVAIECSDEEWSVIPYNILKKHLNPASKIILP